MGGSHIQEAIRPHKPPLVISAWMFFSSLVVLWDVCYLGFRPRSMKGGDLVWIWHPYQLYATIDPLVYGWPAWESGAGFPMAQSSLNVLECVLNFYYLYSSHVMKDPASVLIAFAAVTATLAKTLLYFAVEAFSGFAGIKHNSANTLLWLYIVPNGIWVLVPGLLVIRFGREIARSLRQVATQPLQRKKKS